MCDCQCEMLQYSISYYNFQPNLYTGIRMGEEYTVPVPVNTAPVTRTRQNRTVTYAGFWKHHGVKYSRGRRYVFFQFF